MRRLRGINIGLTLALVLVALLALVPLGERTSVSAESILASSTFDAGNEGWKKYSLGDTGPYDQIVANFGEANYETAGGNPGGHIATDDLDSQTMWFDAPAKFLGNKSGAYGGTLSLDLKLQFAENWSTADVALIGGGTVVVMDVPNPGTSWTHYNLSLTETAGWKKTGLTGGTPTQAEFKTVLTALTALRIRGEFLWGSEYNRLDNVILTGTASAVAPTATPVPAVGGVAASSYFDAGNEGWKKVSLLDNGPYASLNADFGAANFEAAGGNPGGHIATDDLDFQTMWFDAPSKFLGDKSGSYGLTLSYDLKSQFTPDWHTADVALVGGGMVLVVDTADPGTSWTHYNLSLTETAGWKKDGLNGAAPTQSEFKNVLTALTALRVRGEFVTPYGTQEYNRLDNVVLTGTAGGGGGGVATPTATAAPVPTATPAPGGAVLVSSTFDTDEEGWKRTSFLGGMSKQGEFGAAQWLSAGGNPGGHIASATSGDDYTMYFEAPAKFLGDKSAAYGGTLTFDLKVETGDVQHLPATAILVSGGTKLVFAPPNDPGTSWTHFSFSLNEKAGWQTSTILGRVPTEAEFRSVLAGLTEFRIRGNFNRESDYCRLDNVVLTGTAGGGGVAPTATPAPVATPTTQPPPPPPPGGGTQVSYKAGWNIVAGPGGTTFSQANRMLYTSQGSGGYDVLINSQGVTEGYGYWAYFASETTMTIGGVGSSSYSTELSAGQMKMVGNPSGTRSAVVSADKIYTYDPVNGYSMSFGTATLAVGQGAWVFSANGGTVTVTAQ